ncbi:redox-sensitive transcriptional activator SoxR [Phytohabitans flavus]|uniref:MerR family transcriptional regulator n=1 Tax=Phytohabitans flavus TaxID=1076124 RepID=A0A6F8XQX7_9ACTN|nr:redox-sensitive transcriptional activator SoxR [Phytohabitans flavus]BCB76158.1 MerR family transcriptional regulator [Phytohabitans flavus]
MVAEIAAELTVGQLAERSGVSTSALRFYERQGLIHSRRTAGGQRRYDRTTLRRVAFIRASQSVGIPLALIGEVLGFLPEGTPPTKAFWVRASQCWSDALNERIAKMERMRDRFTACIGCGCLSLEECALVNPDDALAAEGPGAHLLDATAQRRRARRPRGPAGGR